MKLAEYLTFFVIVYAHLLAPKLPRVLEITLQNPLTKTFGMFWLLYQKTNQWKFSLFIASGMVTILEGITWFTSGRESFIGCDLGSLWSCKDRKVTVDDKLEDFLDSTDEFIDSLKKYVDLEDPDSISRVENSGN